MKKYICSFAVSSLALLMIAPLVNVKDGAINGAKIIDFSKADVTDWFNVDGLYNLDSAIPPLSGVLYKVGISLYPEETIVGKNGWLFLGDKYSNTLSEKRNLTKDIRPQIDKMAKARIAWDSYVKSYGGKGYFVSFAPDKHTVYPEFSPKWLIENGGSRNTQYLLSSAKGDHTFINMGASFDNLKNNGPLYYKTDTHWNKRGAWAGYKEISHRISQQVPNIKWLTDKDVDISASSRNGGDLSRFLRLQDSLIDVEYTAKVPGAKTVKVYDWYGAFKKVLPIDNSTIHRNVPQETRNETALNSMKVLWLRDSFGDGMEPFMNATFSNIFQQHYQAVMATPEIMTRIIGTYKPDLVIVTAVERQAMTIPWFTNLPK
ncbi:hypothetical protein NU295_12710 [Escherichia coli]|uniref:alginate O-acetyltransferase AlgX-related protein n=1 Tax=Escherichia coli TaxID=562 RepID=UPI00215137DF|nr:hypothetical protein [Escherichia coli]MCR6160867.1 hypothetical protein [Escherichia coli]